MTDESPLTAGATDPSRYAFGDIDLAADRLQLLDRVFALPSQQLVDSVAHQRIDLAVDLGCGPGFTTRLLAERLRPQRLVGLDTSESFLRRAATAAPSAEWFRHDVTDVPFPTAPADLLHARFVISHVSEPELVLVSWLGQLKPGGTLLILEDDEIVFNHPVLLAYEEMARSLVGHRGGELWVGSRLADMTVPPDFQVVVNRVDPYPVPIALAAQMFSMNFAVWRNDPFIVQTYRAVDLEEISIDLSRIARGELGGDEADVIFQLRQMALRRNQP